MSDDWDKAEAELGRRHRRADGSVHLMRAAGFICFDNGPEFVAEAVRDRISAVGAKTPYIEPGSPRETAIAKSFNARLRDELLNGEIFDSLKEAQIVVEEWRKRCNTVRPHSALRYKPPASESIVTLDRRQSMH